MFGLYGNLACQVEAIMKCWLFLPLCGLSVCVFIWTVPKWNVMNPPRLCTKVEEYVDHWKKVHDPAFIATCKYLQLIVTLLWDYPTIKNLWIKIFMSMEKYVWGTKLTLVWYLIGHKSVLFRVTNTFFSGMYLSPI